MKNQYSDCQIAVIGGGNIGTQFACVCAAKGYTVNVCSSKPELYDGELEVIDEFDCVTRGEISLVTSSIERAIKDCQIVFVAHPAFRLKEVADEMLPYVNEDMNICVLPGTGGLNLLFVSA